MNKQSTYFRSVIVAIAGTLTAITFAQTPVIESKAKNSVGVYAIDSVGGTVTDTRSGLMWDRCALGQSGPDCATGTAGSYTLTDALSAASAMGSYKGFNNWRLPGLDELEGLAREYRSGPDVGDLAFPLTPAAQFWTLQPACCGVVLTWQVNFGNGSSNLDVRTNVNRVRLVRVGK